MSSLIHCIYASAATVPFSRADLTTLLSAARRDNAAIGVTGMLIYSEGSFFQVLEGTPATVDNVFAIISADPRHDRVTRIIHEPIPRRAFADWTMGFADMTPAELDDIDGINDFFGAAACLADVDRGRARKLLEAFAKGRWRSTLAGAATRAQVA